MSQILIDGYNLIKQVPELFREPEDTLEEARKNLIVLLGKYRKIKTVPITVVFDGISQMSEFPASFKEKGITVCFTSDGQSADDVIMEMSKQKKTGAIVVTSDRKILNFAESQGSGTMTSPAFYQKLIFATELGQSLPDEDEPKQKKLHKRWATYKKGPRKKLPKKARRNKQKTKKL